MDGQAGKCRFCGKDIVPDPRGSTDCWYAVRPDPGAAPGICDRAPFEAHEPADRVMHGHESDVPLGACSCQAAYGMPWMEICVEPAGHDPDHDR